MQYSPYGKCEVDKILDLNSYKVYELGYIAKTEIKNKKSARQKWVNKAIELLLTSEPKWKVTKRFQVTAKSGG